MNLFVYHKKKNRGFSQKKFPFSLRNSRLLETILGHSCSRMQEKGETAEAKEENGIRSTEKKKLCSKTDNLKDKKEIKIKTTKKDKVLGRKKRRYFKYRHSSGVPPPLTHTHTHTLNVSF